MSDRHVTPDSSLPDIRVLYDLGREINRGHFGTVVAARQKATGLKCALKIIPKALLVGKAANLAKTEKEIMRRLKHDNIVRLHELCNTPTEVIFVMELMQGDLIHYMTAYPKLTMTTVASIMHQLLSAVAYLHSANIVHRDIKADNILLSGSGTPDVPIVKLGDFGLSKIVRSQDALTQNTPCGTAWYMAPEIIRAVEASDGVPQVTTNDFVKQADMWACGVVLYFLIARKPPFQGQVKDQKDRRAILAKINVGPTFTEARWAQASREAMDLCSRLLAIDPERRLSAEAALMHPFLKSAVILVDETTLPAPSPSEVDTNDDVAARDAELADELCRLDELAEEIRHAADDGDTAADQALAPVAEVPAAVVATAKMAPMPLDE